MVVLCIVITNFMHLAQTGGTKEYRKILEAESRILQTIDWNLYSILEHLKEMNYPTLLDVYRA